MGVAQQRGTDYSGQRGHDDGIPEAVVDVAGLDDEGRREKRQESAEPAIADVIRQAHR